MTSGASGPSGTTSDLRAGYLIRLRDLTRTDRGRAGGKAANLGELAQAGFVVPDGVVLTTDAFDRFLTANGLGPNCPAERIETAPLPADLAQALAEVAASFGDAPLAVRSSGVAEDLADASYAGQYDTALDVRGAEALATAVRRCWASAFTRRVTAYQAARDHQAAGLAVLIQRLVRAEAAGVAFTANPVSGARDETIVSAVRGLGERLVSGQASPDEWVVKDGQAICRSAPEGAIDAAQARAVAELARRAEQTFGAPQDVEWALAGGTLYLLQARPITALPEPAPEPIPVPADPPEGFWEREASHFPRPLSPLMRSALLASENAAIKVALAELGLLLETIEHREIGGWVYLRQVPLGGKDRPAPPAWLMPLLIRAVPQMRSRIKTCVGAIRSDLPGRLVQRWFDEWQPGLMAEIVELRDTDLTALSDAALGEHVGRANALCDQGIEVHFRLHGALVLLLGELAFACRDLLGWDDRRTFELLSGLSAKSTEPAHRLAALAQLAAERPAVRRLLEQVDESTAEQLAEADPEFAADFATYQREYGCRALRYEVADPTLAEIPQLILGLIRDQMARGYDPASEVADLRERRAALLAETQRVLAGRSAADRARFERALTRAERAYPVREDNEFYTISAPLAILRYAVLEVGRRLADRGQIARADDVFFLEIQEVKAALRDGADRRPLVAQRQGERAWVEAHPGPASYGSPPGPPPSFRALPSEARSAMEALIWTIDRIIAPEGSQQAQVAGTGALRGIAASPGKYTGPVRVIRSEVEFDKLQSGDVLVCPITSPVWSVLFPSVGALVTDTGGILSHPAIIAREYRVPAVVATGNATELLRDGQIVTVDGATGLVEVQS